MWSRTAMAPRTSFGMRTVGAFSLVPQGAGGASRLRAFRCHVLRADRRAHLGEQPLRLAQLALTSRRIASELRQPGALDVDERREGARAGDLHERRRLVQRGEIGRASCRERVESWGGAAA